MRAKDVLSKDERMKEMSRLIARLDAYYADVLAGRTKALTFVRATTNALALVKNHPHRIDEVGRKNLMDTIQKYQNRAFEFALKGLEDKLTDAVLSVDTGEADRTVLIKELSDRLADWRVRHRGLPTEFVSQVERRFDDAIMHLRQYN